ncbi:MAG: hypothetical protein PHV68_02535 [Candidatus Gastranaerophilales bacterium]|nr:hypothetical protein [Candidatus Gastranaerophilales bacterium]
MNSIKKITANLILICFLFLQSGVLVLAQDTKQETPPIPIIGQERKQESPEKKLINSNQKFIFHGHAEINEGNTPEENIFTGEVSKVTEGTTLKMTVSSVLSTGFNIEGDEFFAEITDDLYVEGGVAIPAGTIAHGTVSGMESSKRLGRDAYVNLKFDYLITPDGREIPIEASMTTQVGKAASVAKVVAQDAGITLAGGVLGGLLALKWLGIGTAITSNGYTVAGGAGVGALLGAGYALGRKGEQVFIAPGDEIKVEIDSSIELPVISEEALKEEEKHLDGLNIKIANYKLEKDPFGELNTITLSLLIKNQTEKTFSSFDMALINDYKAVYYASPFGSTDLWFQKIMPNSYISGNLSFAVDNPKRKHWLVFYDNRTRKPLARISVNNAIRRIDKEKKENKKKKK